MKIYLKIKKFIHCLVCDRDKLKLILLHAITKLYKSDAEYLKKIYKLRTGRVLDLDTPRTFNEKLNWLKLNDRRSIYTTMADKYMVKEYVAQAIGKEYVVPCFGAWERYEDVDFDNLPDSFVLKTNHDSSGATICKDKKSINHKSLRKYFNKLLKRNYFYLLREWPYKNIKPLILAEKLLVDNSSDRLRDYKFWCFNGVPTYMYCTVKGGEVFENFYDMDFNVVNINHGFKRHVPEFDKPIQFDKMKELATRLSKDIPFVRVDFFEVDGKVYFGEFTFYDWGGMNPFAEAAQDLELGDLIKLGGQVNN